MNGKKKIFSALLLATVLPSCAAAQNVRDLYTRVNRSVGMIQTVERAPSLEKQGQLTSESALGSGVLISKDGQMVTAAHVVQTADQVFVRFRGGEKIAARLVASEPYADLAVLKLEKVPATAVPVSLGDSDEMAPGDQIIVIGAPYGIDQVLTVGHISARHKPSVVVKNFEMGEFFQTDAAINEGNSGGPMFNMRGEVIGIVSSILSQSGGFEGIGFVVTSNTVRKLLLEEPTPWSGVQSFMLTDDLAKAFNLPQPAGLLIERVAKGSLAHNAKLEGGTIQTIIKGIPLIIGGDIVLAIQGIEVSADLQIVGRIRKSIKNIPVGGEIRLKVLRAGKTFDLSVRRTE